MPVGLVTGFTQKASKPGLVVTINGGTAVISGSVASFPVADISLQPNATNYIYLNFSSGLIETSTSGFLAGAWPICTVVTNTTNVSALTDMRPDVFAGSTSAATWATLTGTLSNGQVIPYGDAGISRLGAASLALGNGTDGDFTGSLQLTSIGSGSSGVLNLASPGSAAFGFVTVAAVSGRVDAVDYFSSGANGFSAAANSYFFWTNRSSLRSLADGNIVLRNAADTSFGLLQLGGTTSAFPALKRSGAGLVSRLADDTADATLEASGLVVAGANGETWTRGQTTELLTLSTAGTTTDTAANLLPADSIIEAVVARVTTTITTATDWKLGDPTTAGRFSAANASMTAGTTQVGTVHADQTGAPGPRQVAAAKVRVTTTGTPGAGAIRITVFFRTFVAPTS